MQEPQRNQSDHTFDITAKTILGLEELLAEEVSNGGGTDVKLIHRGVQFKGSTEVLYAVLETPVGVYCRQ